MDRLLSLDRLVVFYLVAKHMSFTRAADELHVTQPAVTKRIEVLERDCGQRLFERRPGRLALTAAGAALMPEAEVVYRSGAKATQLIRDLSSPTDLLRIACPQTWSSVLMRTSIPRLHERYPEIRIELQRGNYADMMRNLAEGHIEAALIPMGVDDPRFDSVVVPIKPEPLVVLVPPDHALATAHNLRLSDLVSYPLVLRAHMPFRQLLDDRATEEEIALDIVAEVSSAEDVRQSVLAGYGIGVLPEIGGQPEVGEGRLRAVSLEEGGLLVTCHLVTLRTASPSRALDCFMRSFD